MAKINIRMRDVLRKAVVRQPRPNFPSPSMRDVLRKAVVRPPRPNLPIRPKPKFPIRPRPMPRLTKPRPRLTRPMVKAKIVKAPTPFPRKLERTPFG